MIRNLIPMPSFRPAIGLVVLPLTIPVAYLLYLDRAVKRHCKTATGIRNGKKGIVSLPANVRRPVTLPQGIEAEDSKWVLACERVISEPLHTSSLSYNLKTDLSSAMTDYVRATMTAFSWTPQAFILRASAGDEEVKKTFDTQYIQMLEFRNDDRVNGFWRVVYRDDGRVEMALDAPAAYKGPVVKGVIVTGIEEQCDGNVVFINETWMWRKQDEVPLLLERRIAQWLHVVLSGWLVMKGVRAVAERKKCA
ncbi:hypothetical protein MFIFM68171_09610 [Madurella fahalii]|uniref:Uncharacterized protein n=1 Tax=Madurella fahalii TaxID=1157608 RepID=A0ABQ0GNV0_9PEZI